MITPEINKERLKAIGNSLEQALNALIKGQPVTLRIEDKTNLGGVHSSLVSFIPQEGKLVLEIPENGRQSVMMLHGLEVVVHLVAAAEQQGQVISLPQLTFAQQHDFGRPNEELSLIVQVPQTHAVLTHPQFSSRDLTLSAIATQYYQHLLFRYSQKLALSFPVNTLLLHGQRNQVAKTEIGLMVGNKADFSELKPVNPGKMGSIHWDKPKE